MKTDDYVPKDNDDMVRYYSAYVSRLVTRHNRVKINYADLRQHTWMKLIENDIIAKYRASLGHLPKLLTGSQVVTYLQLPWLDFLRRVRLGVLRERLYVEAYRRDRGVCTKCGTDMIRYAGALECLRKNATEAYEAKSREVLEDLGVDCLPVRFWAVMGETDPKTVCLFCAQQLQYGAVTFRWYPVPHQGLWMDRKALYDRDDVERMRFILSYEKDRIVDENLDPSSVLSKSLFKQYLSRAIHNIYANWCRTRDRRYKEQYKGFDEGGRPWEDTLGDPFGPQQETVAELSLAAEYLAGGGNRSEATDESVNEVIEMFESGRTFQEVARKKGIKARPLLGRAR